MPVRFRFRSVGLSPGSLLSRYWPSGYFRPEIDLFAVGPNGDFTPCEGEIDNASDWVVFDSNVAVRLGLSPPFTQVVSVSGIAGAVQAQFTMPPDGTVSLFLTDYREWYFLPAPPVGFWPPSPAGDETPQCAGGDRLSATLPGQPAIPATPPGGRTDPSLRLSWPFWPVSTRCCLARLHPRAQVPAVKDVVQRVPCKRATYPITNRPCSSTSRYTVVLRTSG
jgi:hypothetical protein